MTETQPSRQRDYNRDEIEDVIRAGANPDDHLRVKVFGKQDTRFLTIRPDQLATLAEVMDETNPPSLLPLMNGCRVLMADVSFDGRGVGTGYVLAEFGGEFATWRVWLHKGECRWLAEAGTYDGDLAAATTVYNERRGDDQ